MEDPTVAGPRYGELSYLMCRRGDLAQDVTQRLLEWRSGQTRMDDRILGNVGVGGGGGGRGAWRGAVPLASVRSRGQSGLTDGTLRMVEE